MDDAELIRQFEARTLPFSEWRHATHIRVAWNYLTRHPYLEALRRIREGIKAYNAANKVEETELFGFHETITEAWARILSDLIARFPPCADSDAFLKEQPQAAARTLLRCYYSRERIVTPQAKQRFVEPDLAPLPVVRPAAEIALPVRRADACDLDALAALNPGLRQDNHGTARTLRSLASGTLLVACEGERVVGYLALDHQFFGRAFVEYLLVHPDARRRGHGLALMRAAAKLAGSSPLFTSTNRSNAPMQALLTKLGFSRCGEVDQLDPSDPELFYVLQPRP